MEIDGRSSDSFKTVNRNGKIPTTAQLALGELAVNAFDGEVFLKQDTAGVGIATRVIRSRCWRISR